MIFTAIEQLPQTILNVLSESKGNNNKELSQHFYKELELSVSEDIVEEFSRIFENKLEEKKL